MSRKPPTWKILALCVGFLFPAAVSHVLLAQSPVVDSLPQASKTPANAR